MPIKPRKNLKKLKNMAEVYNPLEIINKLKRVRSKEPRPINPHSFRETDKHSTRVRGFSSKNRQYGANLSIHNSQNGSGTKFQGPLRSKKAENPLKQYSSLLSSSRAVQGARIHQE